MKVPKNRQTRISDDVWLAGEAFSRHFRMNTTRDGMEAAVREAVLRLSQHDSTFAAIWEQVKSEGLEES